MKHTRSLALGPHRTGRQQPRLPSRTRRALLARWAFRRPEAVAMLVLATFIALLCCIGAWRIAREPQCKCYDDGR